MFCKTCGITLEDNAKVCPECGSVQENPSSSIYYSNENTTQNYHNEIADDKKGFSIISLVLGIVAIVFSFICCVPFVVSVIAIICAIVSIILGIISLKSSKKVLSIVGICLSCLAIVISILVTIFWSFIISNPDFINNFDEGFQSSFEQYYQE